MTDLESNLRRAYAAAARQAPVGDGVWSDDIVVVRPSGGGLPPGRRRSVLGGVVAAAAVVAGVVAAAAVTLRDTDTPKGVPAMRTFVPAGVEYPMRAPSTGPAVPDAYVVATGSLAYVEAGGAVKTTFVTAMMFEGRVVQMRCLMEPDTGAACDPFEATPPQSVSITSNVDNGSGDQEHWQWIGVPAGTSFVEFHEGDAVYWQRPQHEVAAFPTVGLAAGREAYGIAFDTFGVELARISSSTPGHPPTLDSGRQALWAGLSQQDKDVAYLALDQALRPCVEAGTPWPQCVARADATFAAWLAAHQTH